MTTNEQTEKTEFFNQAKAGRSRKKGFLGLAAAVLFTAAGCTAYYYLFNANYVSTNNAYAATEVAVVTPSVNGIVASVSVVDTQYVDKGDILLTLDDADAKLSLQQAEANYGLARRRVRSYLAKAEGLTAMVEAREADVKRSLAQITAANAALERAQIDFDRRQELVSSGSVSREELTNAKTALTQAQAQLDVAAATGNQAIANRLSTIGNRNANNALIEDSTVDTNPEVLQARALYEQAGINLERTIILAPMSGVIAKREVQVGRRVQVGTPLLTIVPVHSIHVDANFKESKLRKVKIGQKVEVTSDLYGDDIVYHGVVTGLSGGTGSAFSLIPAQNATGNWIKVVQRLPVRIELDRQDLRLHPLQVGLSMAVTINTESLVDESTLVRYQSAALTIESSPTPTLAAAGKETGAEKDNGTGI